MKISWFCKHTAGYGDLISPLCYAQNQGEIYDTVVQLDMKWSFLKTEQDSPDKLISRVVDLLHFPNVIMTHRYGCSPGSTDMNEPLKNIKNLDVVHNMYFPTSVVDPSLFVSCTPLTNNESFNTYAGGIRSWKQALPDEQWKLIRDASDVDINYRTPVDVAINNLLDCKFFEGYHGSCAWLARLIGVPMKIHSSKPELTNYCFPWSSDTIPGSQLLLNNYKGLRNEYIDTARRVQAVHSNKESLLNRVV